MGGDTVRYQKSNARFALREVSLVAIAAAAAVILLTYGNLYLNGAVRIENTRIEPYFLVTAVTYLFLRFVAIALEMRSPRVHADLVRCPECGRWLDDPTASGLEAHRRVELTPKPTEKEIVSAVALRRAVDAARLGIHQRADGRMASGPSGPPRPSDLTGADMIAAQNDPDFPEGSRQGPPIRPEPGLKR
jgi:hypothetical protein